MKRVNADIPSHETIDTFQTETDSDVLTFRPSEGNGALTEEKVEKAI